MRDPPSLPEDLRTPLANGLHDTLEDNYAAFLASFKEPRDERKDWYDGFHRLNLKTMTGFELSVRLSWLVDELSTLSASSKGSADAQLSNDEMERLIYTVLNTEYIILKLTSAIPLRDHPFLLHWVTAADRIRGDLLGNRDKLGTQEYGIQEIFLKSRLEIIYCALKGMEEFAGVEGWPEKHVGTLTPLQLMEHTAQMEGEPCWLDLTPYAILLDEAGITLSWELAALLPDPTMQSPEKRLANLDIDNEPSTAREPAPAPATPTTTSKIPTVEEIEKYITIEPEQIIHLLTRLPLDIPSLNLLTELAETTILDDAGADTIHITREYIQHCLRSIEKMGAQQEGNTSSNNSNVSADPSSDTSNEPARGREEQARGVTLLVLFMKNLVRKGFVPVQELVYEIQEVCVRYIFVSEVREFRVWLENGDEEEAPVRRGMGG